MWFLPHSTFFGVLHCNTSKKTSKRPISVRFLDTGVSLTVGEDQLMVCRWSLRCQHWQVATKKIWPSGQICVGGLSLGSVSKVQDTQIWTFWLDETVLLRIRSTISKSVHSGFRDDSQAKPVNPNWTWMSDPGKNGHIFPQCLPGITVYTTKHLTWMLC